MAGRLQLDGAGAAALGRGFPAVDADYLPGEGEGEGGEATGHTENDY